MNGGSNQIKGRILQPELNYLESLSSEMLKSADNDTVNGLSR